MPERVTFLAFSCPHCPLEDKEAVDWLVQEIAGRKPSVVVHLGDGHEADSASRWPSEYDWPLSEEFKAHNEFLRRVREAQPSARRVFLPGNHDANLQAINRIDKKLRDLCDYRIHEDELKHWEQPCDYVYDRHRGVFRLGQVTFGHGYEAAANADEVQSITLGSPYGLWVGGHTHRPLPVTQARKTQQIPLPYWYANAGTLRDIWDVDYMTRKRRHLWGQAIVVGDVVVTKSPRMSRQWDAETVVRTMFDLYEQPLSRRVAVG
jgi:predicted phosphodiesterase